MLSSALAPLLLLLSTGASAPVTPELPAPGPELFHDAGRATFAGIGLDGLALRSRGVEVDVELLRDTLARTEARGVLTLNLFPGEEPQALFDRAETGYGGAFLWYGTLLEEPESSVIFAVTDDVVAGSIRWRDRLYRVQYAGNGTHRVSLVDENAFGTCATGAQQEVSASSAGTTPGANTGTQNGSRAGNPDIDVMVVYSTQARSAAGGSTAMNNLINLAVAETNSAYSSSGITQRLVLVHTELMSGYTEPSSFSQILTDLTGKSDGKLDNVHALRDTYGADAVSMICANGQYCGIAWLMTNVSNGFESNAFSVVNYGCATGYYSFGHELGHNFGCAHDPANAGSAAYSYSYGFRTSNNAYRTIMAYSPGSRIQRFSGPGVTYAGYTMGNASQDNSRSQNNTAPTVAGWRASGINAGFSATPTSGVVPLNVAFTDQSTGQVTSYAWDFGDGSSSTQQNPSHTYTGTGTFTAMLTVSGPQGSSSQTTSITVTDPAPTAAFSASPTSGSYPLVVGFTDQSTGTISSYLWDFGDGTSSTLADPSHMYTAAGSYTARLTVTGPGGSDSATTLIQVFEQPPVAAFNASPTAGTAPLAVSFTNQSTGVIWFYAWDFGDGTAGSSATSPSHTYTSPGSYTATLTATGPGGVDTQATTITVDPPAPVAGFTASPTSGTAPLAVSFTDQSTGTITSRAWDFGDGSSSTQTNPSHSFTSAGSYTVTLTVTGPGGTDAASATITVDPPAPVAAFTASPTTGTAPLAVSFTDQSTGSITSYLWDFGDAGASSTLASPSHTYMNPGTYSVTLTVTGPGGMDSVTQVDLLTVDPAAAIVPYGCGVNPAGSLTVISGLPIPGQTVVLGIDNPLGTQAPGSFPVLALSTQPDANFPCGTVLPGFGMNGVGGELLVSLAGSDLILPMLIGGPWAGPGNPAPVSIPVPNSASLLGLSVYAQGVMFDPIAASGVKFGLTEAVELRAGM